MGETQATDTVMDWQSTFKFKCLQELFLLAIISPTCDMLTIL